MSKDNKKAKNPKKRKKNRKQDNELITLNNAIHILRVSQLDMENWQKEGCFKVYKTDKGEFAIKQRDFKKLTNSKDVHNAAVETFLRETRKREQEQKSGQAQKYLNEMKKQIVICKDGIKKLEEIHTKYHDNLDILNDESALVAAYILYSKLIALLKMCILCLENNFWDVFILFRPINEAIQLAEYFLIAEHKTEGKKYLHKWFRENKSPANSICRKAIEEYWDTKWTTTQKEQFIFKGVMDSIYQATSKSIHHTLNGIIEVYRARIEDNRLVPLGFDYGPCTYPRKIFEMTSYFAEILLSVILGFIICFTERLPLKEEDRNKLNTLKSFFETYFKNY